METTERQDCMTIAVVAPKTCFTQDQIRSLEHIGKTVFTPDSSELSVEQLCSHVRGADILVLDPDNFGGFEKAPSKMIAVLDAAASCKGISLTTTSFGWIDLSYCKKRGISVSNIPGYSREAVAEQTLAYMIGGAKRIFVTDRRTQKGQYRLEMGIDLRGKTLGIIGIGNIGSRVAELAMGIGMEVLACNRTQTDVPQGVHLVSMDEVMQKSDVITFHVTHEEANTGLIREDEIRRMKKGVILINTVDRSLIDEAAMARAIQKRDVDTYVYEGEDISASPLRDLEYAVSFKGFGWYTDGSIQTLWNIVIDNVRAITEGKPVNIVQV